MIFVSFFLFVCFNSLTVHHKKFTLCDFHQEVAFNQYFYLHQQFMFLCACFILLCPLQYFITLARLITLSRAFCSL